MANAKSSKARSTKPSRQPVGTSEAKSINPVPALTVEQKAAKFDELIALYDTAQAAEAEAKQRRRERNAKTEERKRNGITLRGERLRQAENLLSEVSLSGIAIAKLVQAAEGESTGAGAYLTAVEDAARLICGRIDVVLNLLGNPGVGFFELKALTEEEAANLERDEVEADHA